MLDRLNALPAQVRYAALLVAAVAVLILGSTLLTLAGLVARGGPGETISVVALVIFLPIPLAMLSTAAMMVNGRPWAWRTALAYVSLAGFYYLFGLLASFTNIVGFLLSAAALTLLVQPSTRKHFADLRSP